jgi:hypothetical protein
MPIRGAHIAGERNWAYMPTRGTLQRAGMPTIRELEEESQARPCSKAKRVAAVRELTPSLW